ncbi:MAG: hypothetical protein K1X65_05910 [Caldilineales bacterium]|nr:hypothetical protein [Caldilineales bacterium]
MNEDTPTLEQWQRLYAAAAEVKALAPWQWMHEGDLFAVEDPASGRIGFVSIMGAVGEHFAVAVYLGGEGLRGFIAIGNASEDDIQDTFFATPQLQASFEDRSLLNAQDLETIKRLGLKFRGRSEWPLFRSYRPGYAPWHLTADEAAFLTQVLEQVVDVAPRFREHEALFYGAGVEGMLVRARSQSAPAATWEDRRLPELPLEAEPVAVHIDGRLVERLAALPLGRNSVEIDLFMLPAPIREGKGRPYFAYNLLFVDGESGYILGFETLRVETTYDDMRVKTPELVVRQLLKNKIRPRTIRTRPGAMAALLKPLADYCGIALQPSKQLQSLDVARESLMSMMF